MDSMKFSDNDLYSTNCINVAFDTGMPIKQNTNIYFTSL